MKKNAIQNPYILPVAIIGIIIVLGVMYFYPRLNHSVSQPTPKPPVTVENELNQGNTGLP